MSGVQTVQSIMVLIIYHSHVLVKSDHTASGRELLWVCLFFFKKADIHFMIV